MKQFCIKGGIVLIIIFAIDIVVGTVHKTIFAKLPDKYQTVSAIGQMLMHKRAQLIVLGSSSADRHYSPKVLMDSLDIDVYNGGMAGHDVIYCELILRGFMERKKPDYVILDVRPDIIGGRFLGANSDFRPFYGISETVTDYYDNESDWQQRFKILSGLYRNNGSLVTLCKIHKGKDNKTRGYRPLDKKLDSINIKKTNDINFNAAEFHSLQKLVKICKDNQVNLIFCKSPCTDKNESFNKWLINYCEENDIPMIDEDINVLYYKHPEWFYDGYHLNKEGADVFSKIIAHKLKYYIK